MSFEYLILGWPLIFKSEVLQSCWEVRLCAWVIFSGFFSVIIFTPLCVVSLSRIQVWEEGGAVAHFVTRALLNLVLVGTGLHPSLAVFHYPPSGLQRYQLPGLPGLLLLRISCFLLTRNKLSAFFAKSVTTCQSAFISPHFIDGSTQFLSLFSFSLTFWCYTFRISFLEL